MAILGSPDGGAKLGKFDLDVKSKMVKLTFRFEISGPGELTLFTVVFRLELINTNMVLGKMSTQ